MTSETRTPGKAAGTPADDDIAKALAASLVSHQEEADNVPGDGYVDDVAGPSDGVILYVTTCDLTTPLSFLASV